MSTPQSAKTVTLSPRQLWQFIYRPRDFYTQMQAKYGNMVRLRFPHAYLNMALTAAGAHQILKQHPENYEAFQKEAFQGIFQEGSLFVLEGKEHQRERRLLMPAFQPQLVHRYAPEIQRIAHEHMSSWQSGQEIKAQKSMLALSRDVIMSVVFGSDFEQFKAEGRIRLSQMLEVETPLIFMVPQLQGWYSPFWWRYRREKRRFLAFAAKVLAYRRANDKEEMDVLGRLISSRDDNGQPKTDEVICNELYSVLMPGHATTGIAMAWTLYELARNPDILARLRAAIAELGPEPDLARMATLPIMDAVCKETMRLHTIVTETARKAMSPQELHGHAVATGAGMGVGIYAIHHDPELYPEPYSYRPDRFLENEYGPFDFLPFGGGHRRCLGAALSDFEMRLSVAILISNWDFESLQEEKELRHDLGMGTKYGVRLRLSRFNHEAVL